MRGPLLALALLSLLGLARAGDLGRMGPTYPIAEPHFLEEIRSRLEAKARSGEAARLETQARERAVTVATHPVPVPGLAAATSARTFYVDPTYTLERDLVDARGQVIFPAGTRKNPLEIVSLSRRLVFLDARDPWQVEHARRLIDTYDGRVKPVLVGGSYLALMRAWRLPVYYDQQGALVRRLGITRVPALVSQEGLRLRIDEIAP